MLSNPALRPQLHCHVMHRHAGMGLLWLQGSRCRSERRLRPWGMVVACGTQGDARCRQSGWIRNTCNRPLDSREANACSINVGRRITWHSRCMALHCLAQSLYRRRRTAVLQGSQSRVQTTFARGCTSQTASPNMGKLEEPTLGYRLRSGALHWLTRTVRFLDGSARAHLGW